MQSLQFDLPANSSVTLAMQGAAALHYQVITEAYGPWATDQPASAVAASLGFAVQYEQKTLLVNKTIAATAFITVQGDIVTGPLQVSLGVPPGFTPESRDLQALWEQGVFDHYVITPQAIQLSIPMVHRGQIVTIPYRLRAHFPSKAQIPSSQVYEYYTPDQPVVTPPQRIVVKAMP